VHGGSLGENGREARVFFWKGAFFLLSVWGKMDCLVARAMTVGCDTGGDTPQGNQSFFCFFFVHKKEDSYFFHVKAWMPAFAGMTRGWGREARVFFGKGRFSCFPFWKRWIASLRTQ
jgi:hypothetical protein